MEDGAAVHLDYSLSFSLFFLFFFFTGGGVVSLSSLLFPGLVSQLLLQVGDHHRSSSDWKPLGKVR